MMKKAMISGMLALGVLVCIGHPVVAEASEIASESATSVAENSEAAAVASEAASTETQAATSTATSAPVSNPAGSYVAYDEERYPDERAPTLELSEGGGFVFHINLGDGRLAVMTGTYVNNAGNLQLEVLYSDSTDFLGEDVSTLAFTQEGNTGLSYAGEPLGMSRAGDIFVSTGAAGNSGALGQNLYILAPGEVVEL